MTDTPKRQFRVTLKRVTYAEVIVEAATAQQARQQVEADSAHEWFVMSNSIGTDETTVVAVKRLEPQNG